MSKNIKNGWEVKKLWALCKVIGGYAFKSEYFDDLGEYGIIRISNIKEDGSIDLKNIAKISSSNIEKGKKYTIQSNDVLIAMSGATTGKIGIIPENISLLLLQNQRVGNFKIINENILSKKFLLYFLKTSFFQKEILKNALGAAQPNISSNQIEELEIPLPPIEEQIKIAEILEKADKLRQKRKEANKLYDELLQSIFLNMFGDPTQNTNKISPIVELKDICKIERGRFSPRPRNDPAFFNGIYPFIQTGDISNSSHRLKEYKQTLNEKGIKVSKLFEKGTIVIAIVGATIGATSILEIDTYAPDSIIGIKVNKEFVKKEYLEFSLRFFREVLLNLAPSTARANINLEILKPLKIPLPPIELQNKFAEIVEKIELMKEKAKKAEEEIENLFNALMQKAFSGGL